MLCNRRGRHSEFTEPARSFESGTIRRRLHGVRVVDGLSPEGRVAVLSSLLAP
jgi:hypothetical protein